MNKCEALQFFKSGKIINGWKKLARAQNFDVTGMTAQQLWDLCQDSLLCPVCRRENRGVLSTNTGRMTTCGSDVCRNQLKQAKTKATSMERYGVDVPAKHEHVKLKQKDTFESRYGSHPTKLAATQNKRRNTNEARYGCATPAMGPKLQASSVSSQRLAKHKNYVTDIWPKRRLNIEKNLNIVAMSDWSGADAPIQWRHNTCGHIWEKAIPDGSLPWCPKCGVSKEQFGVFAFISQHYTGEIRCDTRKIIRPFELDIYLPELNVAFELNGWYWHKDGNSTPLVTKTELCRRAGIRLIHIMDWEWHTKREIVESAIKHALGLTPTKLNARSMSVLEIGVGVARDFLDANHISGFTRASTHLGLMDTAGNITAVMSLDTPQCGKADLEIIRWAVSKNVSVRGGMPKMLAWVSTHLRPKTLLSYCDLRWETGDMYRHNGFMSAGDSAPNYWWCNGKYQLTQYSTQKHRLPMVLGENYKLELSESDNMLVNGWSKISDCGKGRWIKTFSYN